MLPVFVGRIHKRQCQRHPRFFCRKNTKSQKQGSALGFGSVNVRKNRPDASGRYACLSQAEFSRRYAVSPRSLQEWEHGRRRPESAVRAYLTVIDRNPEAVEKAPMNKS